MASGRTHVGKGAMVVGLLGGLAWVSACSNDASVDFDPIAGNGADGPAAGQASGGSQGQGGSQNTVAGKAGGGKGTVAGADAGGDASDGGTSADGGEPSAPGGSGTTGGSSTVGGHGGKAGAGGAAGAGGKGGTSGGGGVPGCLPQPEICDGVDNDCDKKVDQGGVCPTGCTGAIFEQHLYYFCGTVDSAAAALEKCAGFGMKLPIVESKAENDFIFSKQAGSSWLGGSDELEDDHWLWSDGTMFWQHGAVDGKFSFWGADQPNDNGPSGADENCLVLEKSDNDKEGRWNDLNCSLPDYRATCEGTLP